MAELLTRGTRLTAEASAQTCVVESLLGSGGQGEVYRGTLEGASLAVKWYYPPSATPAQRKTLSRLVEKGPPSPRFLWPLDLVSVPGRREFGYLMALREDRFHGMPDLLRRRFVPTFTALTTAAAQLAGSFLDLHAEGLCYRDISLGNVFFDPRRGDVLICDNDNCAVEGEPTGILGTPDFMAPEVVRGEALPSTNTDLFSLAVLLFMMLMNHHPLSGRRELAIRCLDLPAKTKLFGTDPLFIFDPSDDSNRPDPVEQANALTFWEMYPAFVRALFVQAFTNGIVDSSHGRVRESTWRESMLRLRDLVMYCSCGASNFHDPESESGSDDSRRPCWNCQRLLRLPARLRLGKAFVMLNHDTKLFPHHVDRERRFDFSEVVAEVVRHPTSPDLWGLKNLTSGTWTGTNLAGVVRQVDPGRSVSLVRGTHIDFGKVQGEIV